MRNRGPLGNKEVTDDELMTGVLNRNPDALDCIFARYKALLRTVIIGVMHDESDLGDVIGDVLYQIWQRADLYRPNANGLKGYLVTLARRRAVDRIRRKTAYTKAKEQLSTDAENPLTKENVYPLENIENWDVNLLIGRSMRELPSAQQEIIDLTFFKGMSQREIAAKKNIPLGTVKTRLHLAQRKLYDSLLPFKQEIFAV